MLPEAARPPRQSFLDEPPTVCCDAVIAWMVVIRSIVMPHLSLIAPTNGASQFVVPEAQYTYPMDES